MEREDCSYCTRMSYRRVIDVGKCFTKLLQKGGGKRIETHLKYKILRHVVFEGIDFRKSTFENVDFTGTKFINCNLTGVTFKWCNDIDQYTFVNCKGVTV